MPKQPGPRVLREFEIRKFLGRGSFGTVVEVKHRLDAKKYALKLDFVPNVLAFKEVLNFSKIPAHDHVVSYVTAWEDVVSKEELDELLKLVKYSAVDLGIAAGTTRQKLLCIQMELCGQNLRQWLGQQKQVDQERNQKLFVQLLIGLQHVHDQNLIHRDLKPDNIFFHLKDTNRIKIGDFGIAAGHRGSAGAHHTRGFGDFDYLAPEQHTSTYNKRVDLYAMGLVLYELHFPPAQKDVGNSLTTLKNTKSLPEEFKAWPLISRTILSLLEYDPSKRPSIKILINRFSNAKPISASKKMSKARHLVGCDVCDVKNITGVRYKCSVCENFNMCEKCEDRPGTHPICHDLLKIKVDDNHCECDEQMLETCDSTLSETLQPKKSSNRSTVSLSTQR